MNINRTPPKRLAVMIKLQQLMQGIIPSEGYPFDMSESVVRNHSLLGADTTDFPPILAIIEAPRADFAFFAGEDNSHRVDKWTIMIQGIVADDRTDNTFDDAYYLCQAVEQRLLRLSAVKPGSGSPLYPDDHLLGGMITSVEIAPPVIRPPEAQVSQHAFFYLPIRLGIASEIGK